MLCRAIGLWSDCRAGIALNFALSLPAIVLAVGVAVDYGYFTQQQARVQAAVDAAALASASELRVTATDDDQVRAIARQAVAAALKPNSNNLKVDIDVQDDPLSVTVTAVQEANGIFLARSGSDGISARAVARVMGGTPLCVLGLDDSDTKPAIKLEVNARLTGVGCAVYSNSPSPKSLVLKDGSRLEAELICVAGGAKGSPSNFNTSPLTDCPHMEDPLAERPAPPIDRCIESDLRIGVDGELSVSRKYIKQQVKAETLGETAKTIDSVNVVEEQPVTTYTKTFVTLRPGVYCGGIMIGKATQVTFEPGVYVIKGGPLFVTEQASIFGENVGFYFKGGKANLYFGPNTTVHLTAPRDGPLAGLLMSEDRESTKLQPYAILSDDARVLEGTIYLPQSRIYIDADSPIADRSAYTAIIAKRLDLFAGPHLVLNADYNSTDIPVPSGVADAGRTVVLAE